MAITQGAASLTWAAYTSKLATIASLYPSNVPTGVHIDPQWWSLEADRAKFTFTTTTVTGLTSPNLNAIIEYGSAINIDGDADKEILQAGWRLEPSTGNFVVADFANGAFVSLTTYAIDGASNVWALQNRNTGGQLIVLTGLDEGKLGNRTALNHALAETLIYDPITKSLIHTGIIFTDHESTVVDFDHDGDDDIIALNTFEPANGKIIYLRNDGDHLTALPIGATNSGMGIEVLDLNGDGKWEMIISDPKPGNFIGGGPVAPERNAVFSVQDDLSLKYLYELPIPLFERASFDPLPTRPEWEGNIGRSHDVSVVAGDIDNDGDQDAIISSMLWDDNTPMGGFQILINDKGILKDETDQRMFNTHYTNDASHNFQLVDVNNDGFLDIVSQGHGAVLSTKSNVDTTLTHDNEIYVNDGTGHFVNAVGYQLGARLSSPLTFSVGVDGKPRWTQVIADSQNVITITVAEFATAFSTGPGLTDPALQGTPGFNEFYYLLNNSDAQAAVANGAFSSGLAQYLALGKPADRMTFAPGAHVTGSANADVITLREGNEWGIGGAGNDVISGGGGNDLLEGDGGNDALDGGLGVDIAAYAGAWNEYSWTINADSSVTVRDLRAGAPDGIDTLRGVEMLKFADKTLSLAPTLPISVEAAFANILRGASVANLALANDIDAKLSSGALTNTTAIGAIIKSAGASSSVATLAYEFFTGKIPSAGGMDFLVSPTGPNPNNINGPYYQSFSLENRYINFAVNLGKLGEGNAAFTAAEGSKTLFDATRDAYLKIFGSTPTDTKLHALLDPTFVLNGVTMSRADYFNYYGQDGANGIGTKAAMVGWLLSEAVKADVGTYAKSNDAFLTDLADGATFAVDMVAVYGKPEFVFTG